VSRANTIFAAILVGFIMFVTARGELRSYLSVFGLVQG